jgi:hypothetical protein
MFKFRLVLNLFVFSVLCASCRSSRTGTLSTSENIRAFSLEGYERVFDKAEMARLLSVRRDSLSIEITEYYPPPEGDTAGTGPVKSETAIRYGATTVSDSSAVLTEQETETGATLEDIDISHQEESRTTVSKTVPWYAGWQIILFSVIAVAFIIYCILRRAHIV